jgi:amino acid adenylation domain-containing protein
MGIESADGASGRQASAPAPESLPSACRGARRPYPRELTVAGLVERQARATPDAPALAAGDDVLTYADLNRQANQLARLLRTRGAGPDTLVATCLDRSCALVVAMLGILKAGAAYVPLDPTYPAERLSFMLADAQAPLQVTASDYRSRLPDGGPSRIELDADADLLAGQDPSNPPAAARGADLAYVIYTSGSTGTPKGVQITHDGLLNLVFWHRRAFAVTAADRASQLASPGFDAAGWELWPYLTCGASVHLPDAATRANPEALRDWLLAQAITISFLPTPLAEAVLALPWPVEAPLRYLLAGGDRLHRYPGPDLPFTLVNNYGPTEATVVATWTPLSPQPQASEPPPIGRPVDNAELYVLDEQLRPVADGQPGELYIGGAGLARGYVHRPELTAERFVPHPFSGDPGARLYRTGDLVRLRADGQLAFLGRVDDQIKIRGYRIEPEEIVAALNERPEVRASVVVARAAPSGEPRLVAYLVPAPGMSLSAGALREALRARLPDYMIPATLVRIKALPVTANGKVDHAGLPAPDATKTLRDDAGEEPGTPVERWLAETVASLLQLPEVGVDDNFFLLGGHSLLGTQLIARIADTFTVELPLRTLFESPTVRELAGEIERGLLAQLDAMSDAEAARQLA